MPDMLLAPLAMRVLGSAAVAAAAAAPVAASSSSPIPALLPRHHVCKAAAHPQRRRPLRPSPLNFPSFSSSSSSFLRASSAVSQGPSSHSRSSDVLVRVFRRNALRASSFVASSFRGIPRRCFEEKGRPPAKARAATCRVIGAPVAFPCECIRRLGFGDGFWAAGLASSPTNLPFASKPRHVAGVSGHHPGAGGHWGMRNQCTRRSHPKEAAVLAEDEQSSMDGQRIADMEKNKYEDVTVKPTKKLLTLPTILTLARVAAVPALLAVFYCQESWATAVGAGIFSLAAATDWLDGFLARKMGSSSAFGAFLDPVADKLMVAAALVLLCTKSVPVANMAAIPWLLPVPTIAIIGREITMSAVREWAAAQGGDLHKAVAVNKFGKIKTVSQMIAITLLLAHGEGGLESSVTGIAGVCLLYVAAILALWSLAVYMRGIWGSMFKAWT